MGTFYSISGSFVVRKEIPKDKAEQFIADLMPDAQGIEGELEVVEEDCRLAVNMNLASHMSYSHASLLDEQWIALVKQCANLEAGAVEVKSNGDDYDGTHVWHIGRKRDVLAANLKAVKEKLRELHAEKSKLERRLRAAGNEFFADEH